MNRLQDKSEFDVFYQGNGKLYNASIIEYFDGQIYENFLLDYTYCFIEYIIF